MEVIIMNLEQAAKLTHACIEQMNARYQKPVFDEWAVVSLNDRKGHLLSYSGPRKDGFQRDFLSDAGSLRAALLSRSYGVGDFEFNRHGVGPQHESFMVLGEAIYLICNNTARSMDDIAKDPLWLGAQVPFAELSDKVREDPLSDGKSGTGLI